MTPSKPRLLAFSGFARVGKDLACRLLGGHRLAFADALKADLAPIIRDRYGFDPNNLTPEQKETLRPLFVAHGACARAVDPDIWIRPIEERIRSLFDAAKAGHPFAEPLCITDLRYTSSNGRGDEVGMILRNGGIVLHIVRPGYNAANEEEERSFAAIYRAYAAGTFGRSYRHVTNDGDLPTFANRLKEAVG